MLFNKISSFLGINDNSTSKLLQQELNQDMDTLFDDELTSTDNDMDTVSFNATKENTPITPQGKEATTQAENADDLSDVNKAENDNKSDNTNNTNSTHVNNASNEAENIANVAETEQTSSTTITNNAEQTENTDEISNVNKAENTNKTDSTNVVSQVQAINEVQKTEKVHMSREIAEAQGYICIDSAESLDQQISANPKGKFMLVGDIDMSTINFDTLCKTQEETFLGAFDGNGYEIKNLNNPLFGFVGTGAVINDVNLVDVNIVPRYPEYLPTQGSLATHVQGAKITNSSVSGILDASKVSCSDVGGLIGAALDSIITNCHATDMKVYSDDGSTGGIVGKANGGSISDSSFSGEIKADSQTGGILGCAIRVQAIRNCSSDGSIDGSRATGGILGYSWGFESMMSDERVSTIEGCKSSANITSTSYDVGGIVGLSQDDAITNCEFAGIVQAASIVGGIAGWNTTDISDCNVSGTIIPTKYSGGAFTGCTSENARKCTFTGEVDSTHYYDEDGNVNLNKLLYGNPMEVLYVGDPSWVGPAMLDWSGNKISPQNLDIDIDDRKPIEKPEYPSIPVSSKEVSFDDKDMKFAALQNLGKNAIQTQYAGTWVVFDIQTGEPSYFVWNPDTQTFDKQVLN